MKYQQTREENGKTEAPSPAKTLLVTDSSNG